jgi:hypothetical protein
MVDLRGGEQQLTMGLTFGAGCSVFAAFPARGWQDLRRGGYPVEEDEPLHVVDKLWDPDPLVALAIGPGTSGLVEGSGDFMTSVSNDPCPQKIDSSRHHGRRCVGRGRLHALALLRLSRAGNDWTGTVVKVRCSGL